MRHQTTARRTCALLLTALGVAAAENGYSQRDFSLFRGRWQPVFAWCDAPDRVIVIGQPTNPPALPRPVTYQRFLKKAPQNVITKSYFLGPNDGAAGSVYWTLATRKQTGPSSRYFVHLSNVEKAGQDDDLANHVVEIKSPLDPNPDRCRYDQNAVFMGASAKRTVSVLKLYGGGYAYESHNYPGFGVYIPDGEKKENADGSLEYEFRNGGYTYRVEVDAPSKPGARVVVTKGGQTVLTEAFRVYSDSRPGAR